MLELPEILFIPSILYRDKNIKSLDRDIFAVIYWQEKQRVSTFNATNEEIADLFNVSEGSVANSITRLKKNGYINVLSNRNNQREINTNIEIKKVEVSSINEEVSSVDESYKEVSSINESSQPQNDQVSSVDESSTKEKVSPITPLKENNIYYTVLSIWNSQNIITHRSLPRGTKEAIDKRIAEELTIEDIKQAITNYSEILHGENYFFSHYWTLPEFLNRGFDKFLNKQIAQANYEDRASRNAQSKIRKEVSDDAIFAGIKGDNPF